MELKLPKSTAFDLSERILAELLEIANPARICTLYRLLCCLTIFEPEIVISTKELSTIVNSNNSIPKGNRLLALQFCTAITCLQLSPLDSERVIN
jgi:hypothetical protein